MADNNTELFTVDKHRKTAVETVIDCLKDLLIAEKLKPGDLIPSEMELSESLRVSRGSIREAFKILDAFGVVNIKRGDGTYISDGTNKNIFSPLLFRILIKDRDMTTLIEVRQLLESGINQLVIKYASDDELQKIKAANDAFAAEMAKSPQKPTPLAHKLDIDFHRTVASFCHNPIIEEIYSFVIDLFEPSIDPGREGVVKNHEGITQALLTRDTALAETFLARHTQSWISRKGK